MSKAGKPLVSVIIPVYNVEKYLKECVDSVLGQTYENLEIILVDDGSPDKSGEMCDEFAEQDKRVKVIHKKNEGLNRARESGFSISSGEYILFVDSDDLIASNTVGCMVEAAAERSVDLVVGGYRKFTDSVPDLHSVPIKTDVISKHEAIECLLLNPSGTSLLMMTAWGKLYSRGLLSQIDWSASNYRANEDEFMALQYYSAIKTNVAILPGEFYMYRQNPKSITRSVYKNSFDSEELGRFDTIEHIYHEGEKRLGKKYASLILVKFIYEFIATIYKEVCDDNTYKAAIESYDKYFIPKKDLFDDRVLSTLDPLTRLQFDGLINGGVIGCIRSKLEHIEGENLELSGYMQNLEASIVEKDKSIRDKDEAIADYSNRGIVVQAKDLARSVASRVIK